MARLGERALTETDLQKLFDDVVATVAEILDVEFVKILELVPGDAELLLRAGVGWSAGLVGTAHEITGRHSHAGYALASGGPVIVTDLKSETRFESAGAAARSWRQQRRVGADRRPRRARLRRARRAHGAAAPLRRIRRRVPQPRSPTCSPARSSASRPTSATS